MIARGALVAIALAACGDPPARVQLAPVNPCGPAPGLVGMRVIAYTPGGEIKRSVPPDQIEGFPADTEQLGVEVIGSAGRVLTTGKTAPLAFDALADGTQIPIVMAPPDATCQVGAMIAARRGPAVARAGDGVLVVGGTDAAGQPLSTVEYYDAATTQFTPIDVPASLDDPANGLAGVSLAPLPDGRVALSGTSNHALAVFDPDTRSFTPPTLFDHRAFHASLAIDADHLLVIGGCAEVAAGACSGPPLHSSYVYDLRDTSKRDRGPALPDGSLRTGGTVVDLGVQLDGSHAYELAGGDPAIVDRFLLSDDTTTTIGGAHAHTVALDGGALLTALDDASTAAAIVTPGGALVALGPSPRLTGARLAQLEDGSVIAVGDQGARYNPTTDAWTMFPQVPSIVGPTLAPLPDGTVLILDAMANAWIYRPSLVGPGSRSVIALPDGSTGGVLTYSDPSGVSRGGGATVLTATDDALSARALVGGTRTAGGSVIASVHATGGGVALIGQQVAPGRALVGRLVPGAPARLERLDAGTAKTLCTGMTITADQLALPLTLAVTGHTASLSIGEAGSATVVASCELTSDPDAGDRGQWGIAPAAAGTQLELGPITVTRGR